jgi:hypothetical protein
LVTENNYTKLAAALFAAAGGLLFLSYGYTEMQGSDMWWHVAAGRELLQTRTPWMVDDWSYTAHGADWLNHEWLSDIIYYAWVSLWGVESLVYWKWLVIVATFAILQRALARETGDPLAALVCAGMAAAIAAPFLDVRPHLYSLLNFSILLYLLLGRKARPWVLAPLFLVWVNLHGGFFFGLMALGILVFPWREFNLANLRGAILVGLVCVVAAAFNPSGVGTFLYPLKYAFDESSPFRTLGEWLSPFQPGGIRAPLFFFFMWAPLLALLYALPQVRRQTGIPFEGLALTALTLAMALTSRRFIPLFGMSLAVLLAPLLALALARLNARRVGAALGALALVLAAVRLQPYPLSSGPAFHYLVAEYSYPVDTLDFIETNNLQGKVFALYNWGGYLHWRTDGRMKVYIDGRADTLYDDDTFNTYRRILRSNPGWMAELEATKPDFILWPHLQKDGQAKLKELLESGRWRPVYRDSVSWLLVRNSMKLPGELKPVAPSAWQDLAVARIASMRGRADVAIAHGEKARAAMPWNRTACNVLFSAYGQLGRRAEADSVLEACLAEFPSRYLPRQNQG